MAETFVEVPPAAPPILRRTLHEEVTNRVRDMITEGQLAPGTRINEGLVGKQLGVSRTPLREALKTLASEGLIEIVPARGAVVRAFSRADIADMLEALKALEQTAARFACARASDEDVAGLQALHRRMMELYAERRRLEYFKLNQEIHSGLMRIGGNATLAWAHEAIQARMKRIRFTGADSAEKWAAAAAEHEEMMAALEARDGERLARAVAVHMDETWHRVARTLPD
jgi:DNA-binding GntR family transcriptional regulator